MSKRFRLLDVYVDALSMEETVQHIEASISERKPMQHVVINAGKMVLVHNNPLLKDIINQCSLINADGQAIIWAGKLLGLPLKERVAGIDLMDCLLQLAEQKKYKVYFLGATEEVLQRAIDSYQRKYPDLMIAGSHHGYFQGQEDRVIRAIAESKADLLFVGISSPMKELWLSKNMDQLGVPFCMGVGGSFDIAAGLTRRAPLWMQRAGLEWFYRFIQEPRRMWKRYAVGNLTFISLVFTEWWKKRWQGGTKYAQK